MCGDQEEETSKLRCERSLGAVQVKVGRRTFRGSKISQGPEGAVSPVYSEANEALG